MGTWGPGLLENDTADDLMEELAGLTPVERADHVRTALREASSPVNAPHVATSPEPVVVAAVVVAAALPGGRLDTWSEDHPDLGSWLPADEATALAALAIKALEHALPEDGWYWRSWTDPDDRGAARTEVARLREVLRGGAGAPRQ